MRRIERQRAPSQPEPVCLTDEDLTRQLNAVGQQSAAEQVKQCSVPKEGGWRPGARWARRGRGQTVFEPNKDVPLPSEREPSDVEAAIAGLPPHQRPPSRELGRTSEAAANPFMGAGREMARRCEAATHPFKPEAEDWNGKNLQAAIDDLPTHRRPAAKSLLREIDVVADPFTMRGAMPVQFPGEDAPAKRFRGIGTDRAKRPTSRDGHNGEANALAPPNLARLADMPAPKYHGEGIRPSTQSGSTIDETGLEKGRFFQTGRTLGPMVGRVCRDTVTVSRPVQANRPPLATIEKTGARIELVAVCPAARARGLRPGMALTTARAQIPELDTRPSDEAGDCHDLHRLAELLARRWSPTVEVCDNDGLLIDLTGVAHLHGGERAFCRRLVRILGRHGISARMAVADTIGAAWAVSRYAGAKDAVHIVPPGEQQRAISPLPPAALRLNAAALELLDRLGIVRIGEIAAMPRASLARRFTRAIVDRLDQALGNASQTLDPVSLCNAIIVTRRFLEPIATAEAIQQVLRDLTPEMTAALRRKGRGVRSLELVADRVDGVPQRLRVGFARPTRDGSHMLRLMLRRVEEIEPGYGIDSISLHVRRCDALEAEALGPKLVEETPPELGTLVDAIANRIGADRLWRAHPVESDVPERCLRRTTPLDQQDRRTRNLAVDDVARLNATPPDHPWHPRWPRPARLLHRPERVHHVISELPDLPPKRFTWRGRTYRVIGADGPERITSEWWRRTDGRWAIRDYYLVETKEGGRFWLFRRGDGVNAETGDLSWYLHGR